VGSGEDYHLTRHVPVVKHYQGKTLIQHWWRIPA
jgi:hypothetical protein